MEVFRIRVGGWVGGWISNLMIGAGVGCEVVGEERGRIIGRRGIY